MKHFGERLKKLRTDNNITQCSLAEYLGISYQAISKWENSLGLPDISMIPSIANFFGVSSDYLLGIQIDKGEQEIEKILEQAKIHTHTGELDKSIDLIQEALTKYPNEHRLLCDLIDYKVRVWDNDSSLEDIENKANLILRDCTIDKIRHKTIVNLAFAYSAAKKWDKVSKVSELLPDVAYSKKQLLSLSVEPSKRLHYKTDCVLGEAECMLHDILSISKYHILYGDPEKAIDVCNRALTIIDSIGAEGYLLYMQAAAYEDLTFAYGKLQRKDNMYLAMKKVIEINENIENILSVGGKEYKSPLLNGLYFSKEAIAFNDSSSDSERFYNMIIKSKILKPYRNEKRFVDIINQLENLIK